MSPKIASLPLEDTLTLIQKQNSQIIGVVASDRLAEKCDLDSDFSSQDPPIPQASCNKSG